MLSDEKVKTAVWYMRVNSADQLSASETDGAKKTKRVWRARATGKTYPCPPWDRETEHLKNVAKKKGLGVYRVNSPEQRIAIKESWAEFERANRVTMDDITAMLRKFMNEERAFLTRDRI